MSTTLLSLSVETVQGRAVIQVVLARLDAYSKGHFGLQAIARVLIRICIVVKWISLDVFVYRRHEGLAMISYWLLRRVHIDESWSMSLLSVNVD